MRRTDLSANNKLLRTRIISLPNNRKKINLFGRFGSGRRRTNRQTYFNT